MGQTPAYSLPYPDTGDPAAVPQDIQDLAARLDVVLPTLTGLETVADSGVLPAAAPTIQLDVPANTYKHLTWFGTARSDAAQPSTLLQLLINQHDGPGYYTQMMLADAATVAAGQYLSPERAHVGRLPATQSDPLAGSSLVGFMPGSGGAAYRAGVYIAGSMEGAAGFLLECGFFVWLSGAQVANLTFLPAVGSFIAGSHFTLYGLK